MTHTCINKNSNTTDAVCNAMTGKDIVPLTLCISCAHDRGVLTHAWNVCAWE